MCISDGMIQTKLCVTTDTCMAHKEYRMEETLASAHYILHH